MRLPGIRVVLLVLTLFIAPSSVAATGTETPITIGKQYSIASAILGEERELFVHLPRGYEAGTARYPVLYLLDGGGHFLHATGVMDFLANNGRMPEMIVVGIGNTDRMRDFSPPTRAESLVPTPRGPMPVSKVFPTAGGADRFLRFLSEELAPHIEATYRTQPYRVLVGHSLGGLFALHVLQTRPEAFNVYFAISPSLFWDDQAMRRTAPAALARLPETPRALYLTMGNENREQLESIQAYVRVLERAKPKRLSWRYSYLKDDNHASTPHRSLYDGLESIFHGWTPSEKLLESGDLAAIERHYAALARRFGYDVAPPERLLNMLGYAQLQRKGPDAAIPVFRRNAELYPLSANVHDSLAEALEAAGKLEEALSAYERALQRGKEVNDPNVPLFLQHVDKLRKRISTRQ